MGAVARRDRNETALLLHLVLEVPDESYPSLFTSRDTLQ
jgi:hypothetical protein